MARGNKVHLYGIVTDPPRFCIDNDTGDITYAFASIKVIRGQRNAQDGKRYATFAYPRIYTKNPEMIKLLQTWDENDLVAVEGEFHQTTINKTCACSECGELNIKRGDFGYIEPTFLNVNEKFDDSDEALYELRRFILVSNEIDIVGNLGRNPRRMTLKSKQPKDPTKKPRTVIVCEYPIISHRLRFVEEDPVEKKEDMIWVKTYGKNVDQDYFRLVKGSEVSIDGFLQTRSVNRIAECDFCHKNFVWNDVTMEVVPYENEYIKGYRTQEEADRVQQERAEQSARDILAQIKKNVGVSEVNETGISENEINEDSGLTDDILKENHSA